MEKMEKGGFLGVACKEAKGGVLVVEAIKETPAESSGLQPDDLLISIDEQKIDNREELTILIASKNPGDEIKLEYQRNGKSMSSKIKLGKRPGE